MPLSAGYFPAGYFPPSYFGASPALPVLLSLSVTVSFAPNPSTSALQIVETGQVFGPYPDSVSANGDGTFALTIGLTALPAGLAAGIVSVQPGDVIAGVFVPAEGVGPTEGMLQSLAEGEDLDWDASVSGPFVSITAGSYELEANAVEWVHMGWSITDAITGLPVTLTGNSAVLGVRMAIVQGDPVASDWQPATLITRAAGTASNPSPLDGEYSAVKVGPGQVILLAGGTWYAHGQILTTGETIIKEAPGYLSVTGSVPPGALPLAPASNNAISVQPGIDDND